MHIAAFVSLLRGGGGGISMLGLHERNKKNFHENAGEGRS